MSAQPRKSGLERRLAAHFAVLRSGYLKDLVKHSAVNWSLYAAVASSALAMSSKALAYIADADVQPAQPSAEAANHRFASSENSPWAELLGLAPAKTGPVHPKARQATAPGPPSVFAGGIVPLYSHVNTIQPGEWVSIYGNNLAAAAVNWDGNFPTTLGGTSVQINGKPAYLSYVSPTQINLQAPDDNATGTVSVVVTTAAGSATSTVTLGLYAPSFCLQGSADTWPALFNEPMVPALMGAEPTIFSAPPGVRSAMSLSLPERATTWSFTGLVLDPRRPRFRPESCLAAPLRGQSHYSLHQQRRSHCKLRRYLGSRALPDQSDRSPRARRGGPAFAGHDRGPADAIRSVVSAAGSGECLQHKPSARRRRRPYKRRRWNLRRR